MMLQEIFEGLLAIGGTVGLYHLLGGWSAWLKVRPIARLFTAIFICIIVLTVIFAAIQ